MVLTVACLFSIVSVSSVMGFESKYDNKVPYTQEMYDNAGGYQNTLGYQNDIGYMSLFRKIKTGKTAVQSVKDGSVVQEVVPVNTKETDAEKGQDFKK